MRRLVLVVCLVLLSSLSSVVFAGQKFKVRVLERREVPVTYTSAARTTSYGMAHADCDGDGCDARGARTTRYHEAQSFERTAARLFLLLPDGRVVVADCMPKETWTMDIRSCKVPPMDQVEVEFSGDKAKVKWPISVDGKKLADETYKVFMIHASVEAAVEAGK